MASIEQMRLLMAEIGPAISADIVEEYGPDFWGIAISPTLHIEVDYDAELAKVTLSTGLGPIGGLNPLATCRTLLQYNYLWQQTGGLVLALEPADGEVMQILSLPLEGLTVQLLGCVLRNFGNRAEQFRELLKTGGLESADEGDTTDAEPVAPTGPADWSRV